MQKYGVEWAMQDGVAVTRRSSTRNQGRIFVTEGQRHNIPFAETGPAIRGGRNITAGGAATFA